MSRVSAYSLYCLDCKRGKKSSLLWFWPGGPKLKSAILVTWVQAPPENVKRLCSVVKKWTAIKNFLVCHPARQKKTCKKNSPEKLWFETLTPDFHFLMHSGKIIFDASSPKGKKIVGGWNLIICSLHFRRSWSQTHNHTPVHTHPHLHALTRTHPRSHALTRTRESDERKFWEKMQKFNYARETVKMRPGLNGKDQG